MINITVVLSPYTGPYQISGVVTNTGGTPVAGVHVYAGDGVGDNLSTLTGGSGRYPLQCGQRERNWGRIATT